MKLFKSYINEKFVQNSDPIKDMGIGIFVEHNFKSFHSMCNFLLESLPAILKTSDIPSDIVFLPKHNVGAFKYVYYYRLNDYIKKYVRLNGRSLSIEYRGYPLRKHKSICTYLWETLLKMGYPKIHQTRNPDKKNK